MRQLSVAPAVLALVFTACSLEDDPTAPSGASPSSSRVTTVAALGRAAQDQGYVPGRVVVGLTSGAPVAQLVAGQGAEVERALGPGIMLLSVPAGREMSVADALAQSPFVEFAEPDWFYTVDLPCGTGACAEPTDPSFGFRWDLYNDGWITDGSGADVVPTGGADADLDWLEAFDAVDAVTDSAVIGIIDTGIRGSHEELAGKVMGGYDFFGMTPDWSDDHGHGTHVAGIAAGRGDNGAGVPGIAWVEEVKVSAAKVCGYLYGFLHGCPSSAIADGIRWATDNGADVLNISLGGGTGSTAVQSALQYARQAGVLPFCAAGNEAGPVSFPAAFPECVAVSSTDWSDGLASYSNLGPEVELSAPGGDTEDPNDYSRILSSFYAGDASYAWLAGTSMASPQAAGLAGLLHALGVSDPDQKLTRMTGTADDLGAPGRDDAFGWGRINVYTAVADLVGAPSNQVPNVSFTVACEGRTCAFTDASSDGEGDVVSWSWDFGDGAGSTEQHPIHTYAADGTYAIVLTATDDEGLSASSSMELIVPIPNEPPTASFTSACDGYTCDFTDTSSDPDGSVVTWSWDFGDGATSTAQSPSHTYATAGAFTVTLTVTDDDGDTDEVTATAAPAEPNDPPTASFTSSCTGLSCTFAEESSDGDGAVTSWSWSFGDGWSTNAQNPTHTYPSPGSYAVTLTVTDDDNATGSITDTIAVFEAGEAPTASFTASCDGLSCDFTDGSTDDNGAVTTWSWDFGDGATSTAQHPSHTYAADDTYTVTLTVTDDVGASDTVTRSVTVPSGNQPPTASFTSSCAGLSCSFTDTSADGDGTIAGWSWDFGDGSGSTAQNPTHGYDSAGTYAVTLTATDDGGASDTTTVTVTVTEPNQQPSASFSWFCSDLTCDFTDESSDADGTVVSRSWSFGDGWSTNATNPSHTYPAPGAYTVTLTVTDDDTATGSYSADVTVVEPGDAPTASFTSSCVDLSCTFTDTSSPGTGPIVSWSWDFGDGDTSTEQSPSHAFTSGGTYPVVLLVTDDRGVTDQVTKSVAVPAPNQPPTATFTSSCSGLTCEFIDGSADGDGAVASWNWDFGDGTTSSEQSPTHTYEGTGSYTVTLTVTDDDGDTDGVSKSMTVTAPNQPPSASFTWSCDGLDCAFTDASTDDDGSVGSWSWSFGDGWSSNARDATHTYGDAGTYSVSLTVSDDDGATDIHNEEIVVGERPAASFSWSCTDLTCDFTDTSTDGDGTVVFWSWDFGDGESSFVQNPSHSYAADGTYTVRLTVTDDDGATALTSESLTLTRPPVVITLGASPYKVRGLQKVDLTWSGATAPRVDVYRDDVLVLTTSNDGLETDHIDARGSGVYTYLICEAGSSTCSKEVTAIF